LIDILASLGGVIQIYINRKKQKTAKTDVN
jgi:hypothetical protein